METRIFLQTVFDRQSKGIEKECRDLVNYEMQLYEVFNQLIYFLFNLKERGWVEGKALGQSAW